MLTSIFSYMNGEIDTLEFMTLICVVTFVTFCCLPVHECAHAWMADKLGDSTGRLSGRINLSPMAHLSWQGTLMLFLFGFGYAKPVPVNIRNFKKRKLYFGITALAGPISNLIMAIVFIILASFFAVGAEYNLFSFGTVGDTNVSSIASSFFFNVGYYNIALAVFNLIPFPPLDGSRILTMILPDKIYYKILGYERYLFYALFGLIFLFNRIGISPIGSISQGIFIAITGITRLLFTLIFGLFI